MSATIFSPPESQQTFAIEPGRFCQINCFQEALIPLLRRHPALRQERFEWLRAMTWNDVLDGLRGRVVPGLFGGMAPSRMSDIYRIRWAMCEPGRGNLEALVADVATVGPPLVQFDRYQLPADEIWYRRGHRIHTVLVVDLNAQGVAYLDGDHPLEPVSLSWPEAEGALAKGRDGLPMFIGTVHSCHEPDRRARRALRADFAVQARTLIASAPALVASTVDECLERLFSSLGSEAQALTEGLDSIALLNGLGRSLEAAAGALANDGLPGVDVAIVYALATDVLTLCRRSLMLILRRESVHLRNAAARAGDTLVAQWDTNTRAHLVGHLDRLTNAKDAGV